MPGHNTHLSSEFYILSCLHRLGFEAYLVLGNAKKIDITVVDEKQQKKTIDVKGMAAATQWRISNIVHDEDPYLKRSK